MDRLEMEYSKERIHQDPYVAVNIKTKEILALEVTDKKVHDGRMLMKLINHVLDNSYRKIESVLADGAYDTNSNFRYFKMNEIRRGIKVRKNFITSLKIIG